VPETADALATLKTGLESAARASGQQFLDTTGIIPKRVVIEFVEFRDGADPDVTRVLARARVDLGEF
jgi:hypothetical protein